MNGQLYLVSWFNTRTVQTLGEMDNGNDSLISDIDCMIQVIVRNVPPDPDESVSELVEHFFLVNHPDHYLTHQVSNIPQLILQKCH